MVDKDLKCVYKIHLTDQFVSSGRYHYWQILREGKELKGDDFVVKILSFTSLKMLPDYLAGFILEKDYSNAQYSWIILGESEDDTGKVIVPQDKVGFFLFDDFTLITKECFYSLCLDIVVVGLEAAQRYNLYGTNIVTYDWADEMRIRLTDLKQKIHEYE